SSVHVIFGRATVVRDVAGNPIRVYGTNADVTERKRAEQELQRHAKQQAAIAQLSLLAMRGDSLQDVFEEAVQLLTRTLDVAHSTKLRKFSEDEVNFVWSVANLLATAIEQQRAAGELAEKREQLQALSRQLIEAQEAERRVVARELHDDFGQVLTAIKLNLVRRDRDDAETIALVDGAIARMRELAHDLRPPLLDEFGLEASLRWYVEREAKRAGLDFRLALATLARRPPIAVETTCFRIAQEALTNVIRHAQAHVVDVELSAANGTLQLVVHDDGRGFDVSAARMRAAHGGSQGLLSMQERVALAGGDLEIDSAPGRGTTVRARLPLTAGSDT